MPSLQIDLRLEPLQWSLLQAGKHSPTLRHDPAATSRNMRLPAHTVSLQVPGMRHARSDAWVPFGQVLPVLPPALRTAGLLQIGSRPWYLLPRTCTVALQRRVREPQHYASQGVC